MPDRAPTLEAAGEALAKAARRLTTRNVYGIYESTGRALYPEFLGVVREDYDQLRDALAAWDGAREPREG